MVDASAAGQQARAIGDVGKGLFAIGQKMDEVRISTLTDEAKIQATQLMNEANQKAVEEAWTDSYKDNRQRDIQAIRQNVLSTVKDPRVANRVQSWLELNLAQEQARYNQYGYQKLIKHKKDTLDTNIFHLTERMAEGALPESIGMKEINNLLAEAIQDGILNESQALESSKKIKENISKEKAKYDMWTTPEIALENLNSGKYENLSALDRAELIDKTQNIVKKREKDNKIIEERNQINKETELIFNIGTGEVDEQYLNVIDDLVENKDIRPELAQSAIRGILHPIDKYDMKEDDEAFVGLVQSIFKSDNPEKIRDTLKDILDGYNQSEISKRNMTLMIQTAKDLGDKAKVDKRKQAVATYNRVVDWAEKNGASKPEMLKDFMQNLRDGKDPQDAADTVIDNAIMGIDPSYKKDQKQNTSEKVIIISEGQTIKNPATGEVRQMIGGEWVRIQ